MEYSPVMADPGGRKEQASGKVTPAMKQYWSVKEQYRDAILLFHIGDFYETFGTDAETISRELDIALTSRSRDPEGNRIPLAGVPCHAATGYITRLVSKGYRVAICDQVEEAKNAKGVVRREVVRVITPGTAIEEGMLPSFQARYLMAISDNEKAEGSGLAFLDLSTGEFFVISCPGGTGSESLNAEIRRYDPAECIIPVRLCDEYEDQIRRSGVIVTRVPDDSGKSEAGDYLCEHFGPEKLEEWGISDRPELVKAAAVALRYACETQKIALPHVTNLSVRERSEFCMIDGITLRNLEILQSIRGRPEDPTLFCHLNLTGSPMGARLLRQWLSAPLLAPDRINDRLDAVEFFTGNTSLRIRSRGLLTKLPDLERIAGRIACGNASPRDLQALARALEILPSLAEALGSSDTLAPLLAEALAGPGDTGWVKELIQRALADDPPVSIRNGGVFREGYSSSLDALRTCSLSGKDWIVALQQRERARTGIKSLKVSYNTVFGYFIEVTKANLHLVPREYDRKQTTSTGERFTLPELKEQEAAITTAEEKILALEQELYTDLLRNLARALPSIQATAASLGIIDVFAALGEAAVRFRYTRPVLDKSRDILIREGRHPVVEAAVKSGFVPNDTQISANSDQILIITGANMAGKSTYMRAVAEMVVMAQAGCFVPAAHARFGVVDRIFTRVGAFDDLASGQSTFMVEMLELANILNNVTGQSLVILDEIGRGTSTLDGYCIARSVLEFLHGKGPAGPRTLFATHFHEIVTAESDLKRVRNYHFAVSDTGSEIIFLRKLIPGATDRSYGIHVASLAGVPEKVTKRASALLSDLIRGERGPDVKMKRYTQVLLVDTPGLRDEEPLLGELRQLDPDSLTPRQALDTLYELVRKAGGRRGEGR
jgi:DNA mismatch repair protein MutS